MFVRTSCWTNSRYASESKTHETQIMLSARIRTILYRSHCLSFWWRHTGLRHPLRLSNLSSTWQSLVLANCASLYCGGDPVASRAWRRHDIDTLSALLAFRGGSPLAIGKTPVRIILWCPTAKMLIKACLPIQPLEQEGGCQKCCISLCSKVFIITFIKWKQVQRAQLFWYIEVNFG